MTDARDAGSGDDFMIAVDWLLNSRYMDPEALEHFWHRADRVTDCDFCHNEFAGTSWDPARRHGGEGNT